MQITKIIMMLVFLSGLSISTSWAKFVQWQPQIPSSLDLFNGNAKALANLAGDHIVIFAHPSQQISLPTMKAGKKSLVNFKVPPWLSQPTAKMCPDYSVIIQTMLAYFPR
jgi:hypothetical protein